MQRPMSERLLARLALAAHDALALCACALIVSLGFAQVAYAYVDPSVMTYTIQALAGVAVALSAVAGVAFRRTRKALMKALNIDENANKERDGAWERVEPDPANLALDRASFAEEDGTSEDGVHVAGKGRRATSGKAAKGSRDVWSSQTWPRRLALAAIASIFTVGTLFVVAPYELVAASEGSLIYGLDVVWAPIALFAALVALALCIVMSLFRGRGFFIVLSVVFSIGLCCWVQALFMNQGLPLANGQQLELLDHKRMIAVSTVVWAALIALPLWAGFKLGRAKLVQAAIAVLSVALILVQGAGVASLFAKTQEQVMAADAQPISSYVTTREGMYTLSGDKHNVVVFVLDTVDTQYVIDSLELHPDMLDEFTGFTWYKDSVGSMIPTRYGNVYLFTGVMPEHGEDWHHFLSRRFEDSDYLQNVHDAGYSIGMYTDTMGVQWIPEEQVREYYDYTFNIRPLTREQRVFNPFETVLILEKCALYRDAPWLLKPPFWFYTDDVNLAMAHVETVSTGADNEPYTIDDARWLDDLQDKGITATDEHAQAGSYRFIHLYGTHRPYNIDEYGDSIDKSEATLDRQTQGSMFIVAEYVRCLKEIGVYDNTTIIVTADHGEYLTVYEPLEEPTSPVLMVKPAQSAELDAQPLKVSMAPVTAGDILATTLDAMGMPDEALEYGIPVSEIPEGEYRPRVFLEALHHPTDRTIDGEVLEYDIIGYVLDMDNWKLTGETWTPY